MSFITGNEHEAFLDGFINDKEDEALVDARTSGEEYVFVDALSVHCQCFSGQAQACQGLPDLALAHAFFFRQLASACKPWLKHSSSTPARF